MSNSRNVTITLMGDYVGEFENLRLLAEKCTGVKMDERAFATSLVQYAIDQQLKSETMH